MSSCVSWLRCADVEAPQLAERAKNGTLPPTRTSKGRRDMAGVKQARDGAVGILTLDEPASLNAMTPDLLGALAAAVAEMTRNEDVRALILTGAGRGFCSGQNLKASGALGEDLAAGVMRLYWPAFKALRKVRRALWSQRAHWSRRASMRPMRRSSAARSSFRLLFARTPMPSKAATPSSRSARRSSRANRGGGAGDAQSRRSSRLAWYLACHFGPGPRM
jgi:Enoyl-CoA hydratase/isomerase